MASDKELTGFINKALGTVTAPESKPRRQPKRIIYRWNLREGGLNRITEKEAEAILAERGG